jgi:phage/plasmid-associated DNA primase
MSLQELISHWTSEKFQQRLEREKKEILPKEYAKKWKFQVLRYGSKFLRSIHQIGGEFLPLYEPNENYVEFNDGFYEISTGNLLTELDEDIVCFCYFSLSFERNVNVCPPKRWLSILENSLDKVQIRNFCRQYAILFRGPKQRRNRCLYLVGESQCGKSSLLAPLEGIFGRENIGITSRDKKFSLEDLVAKRIGILDEFSRNQLSREDFLLQKDTR